MKIQRMHFIVIIIVLTIPIFFWGSGIWYNHPRKFAFELTLEIPKPNATFDRSDWLSYDYIRDNDELFFFMVEYYNKFSSVHKLYKAGYDTLFIENLSKQLDFKRYDYIITYKKQLKSLDHSPYLTKHQDGLYFDKRTPLIPSFDTIITNKVYIYQIKKNKKFRAPGP